MINLLMGAPGSGKSYEAVAFHILPALENDRLVITNLPLNVQEFADYLGKKPNLLIIEPTRTVPRPFSTIDHYAHPWRDPKTGTGPLYVIDECHLALPKGSTPVVIEEWFSMHRHESADVLLITQSYGKVSKAIIDMLQIVYRVRKNIALGSSSTYIRKVFDGVRGECVNMNVRKYNPKFFGFYQSYTKGGKNEAASSDIRPIWKHPVFYGAGLCLLFILYQVFVNGVSLNLLTAGSSSKDSTAKSSSKESTIKLPTNSINAPPTPPIPVSSDPKKSEPEPPKTTHPFKGLGIHIVGALIPTNKDPSKYFYMFRLSQNGQPLNDLNHRDFIKAGYKLDYFNECLVKFTYQESSFYSYCDYPRHSGATSTLNSLPGVGEKKGGAQ